MIGVSPGMGRVYYVYILASRSRTLYVGVTNDLFARLEQHRRGTASAFTRRFKVRSLVYFESTGDIRSAIAREKELKGWRRERKLRLIEKFNPDWQDLSIDWRLPR